MLATAKTSYRCPQCNSDLSLDTALAGRKILCPKCKKVFRFSAAPQQPQIEANLDSPNATPRGTQTRFTSWTRTALAFFLGVYVTVFFNTEPSAGFSRAEQLANVSETVSEADKDVVKDVVSEAITSRVERHISNPDPTSKTRVEDNTRPAPDVPSRPPDPPKQEMASSPEPLREVPKEIRTESAMPTESRPKKLTADIIIVSVSVASSKRNGSAWDVNGGAPDIQVYVGHDYVFSGTSAWTSTKQDTYYATFNEKMIRVKEGERIKIQVWDSDALDDDLIGEYVKEITAETLRQGTVIWTFDQVLAITIKFEP